MNKRKVYYNEIEGIAWTFTPRRDRVVVSWEDRHWIEKYSVSRIGRERNCYAGIDYKSKRQYLHRLIMQSQGYHGIVDHSNRNRFDNRRENLRPATRSINMHNKSKQANASSIFLGVSWNKRCNKWEAYVSSKTEGKSKRKHLGKFSSEVEAALAYDAAVAIYQSPGATTNESLGLL